MKDSICYLSDKYNIKRETEEEYITMTYLVGVGGKLPRESDTSIESEGQIRISQEESGQREEFQTKRISLADI